MIRPPFARMRQIIRDAERSYAEDVLPKNIEEVLPSFQVDLAEPSHVVEEAPVTEPVEETPIEDEVADATQEGTASPTEEPLPITEWKRTDLNTLAQSLGIEHPEKFPNKKMLILEIEKLNG